MKALQHVAHGDPAEVVNLIDLPDPEPAADEVVIDMEASAVHLADIKLFRGDEGFKHDDLPKQPGYEGVGVISTIGSDVTTFKIGDRVFPWWGAGTFAQKVCVKAETTMHAPAGDADQLALMMVNGMTSVCLSVGGLCRPQRRGLDSSERRQFKLRQIPHCAGQGTRH